MAPKVKESRMRWTNSEEEKLKSFVIKKKQSLLINFYKNILVGELRFRKEAKLFLDMSAEVGRTPEQCKSKMQKFEKVVYCQFLEISEDHYQVFEWLRKKKSKKNSRGGKLHFKNQEKMENLWRSIVDDVRQGKIIFAGTKISISYII